MYRYSVVVTREPDDHMYVVSVPALPGCYTQGDTVEQAVERAQEAITGYLASLTSRGKPIPIETTAPRVEVVTIEEAALASS